jgi:hypothetical protein
MRRQVLASALAIAVVVAAIVAGLVVSGSPQRQRQLRLDEQRVNDLRSLSQSITAHYRNTRELPGQITEIVDGRTRSTLPRDPESGQAYVYETQERRVFQLCAEFALPSEDTQPDEFWSHQAGRQCFRFDLSSLRFQ